MPLLYRDISRQLSSPIPSQGWHRRAWLKVLATLRSKGGTKLCKSARRALTVRDNSRCGQLTGFGLMLSIASMG